MAVGAVSQGLNRNGGSVARWIYEETRPCPTRRGFFLWLNSLGSGRGGVFQFGGGICAVTPLLEGEPGLLKTIDERNRTTKGAKIGSGNLGIENGN